MFALDIDFFPCFHFSPFPFFPFALLRFVLECRVVSENLTGGKDFRESVATEKFAEIELLKWGRRVAAL